MLCWCWWRCFDVVVIVVVVGYVVGGGGFSGGDGESDGAGSCSNDGARRSSRVVLVGFGLCRPFVGCINSLLTSASASPLVCGFSLAVSLFHSFAHSPTNSLPW